MSTASDFIISNGVLTKYVGPGGDVIIPDGVIGIGDSAFSYCSSLTGVTIPSSVTDIGNSAFLNCSSLTDIVIPDGVTCIGDSVFSGCSRLTGITLPDSVTSIGIRAFNFCISLTDVAIPETVTSIGDYAFYHCSALTEISLPHGITRIGFSVFSACSSLTAITIPDSVTDIRSCAFSGCSRLTGITLPDSVTSIGMRAFSGVPLPSVVIPEALENVSYGAFAMCNKVEILSKKLSLPAEKLSVFSAKPKNLNEIEIFAPHLPLSVLKEHGLAMPSAITYLCRYLEYDRAVEDEYINYISSQKKHLLPIIFQNDQVEILQKLSEAKKITSKNVENDFLLPAINCNACRCVEYLETIAAKSTACSKAKAQTQSKKPNWDGQHFSIDGKKLIRYEGAEEEFVYHVPEGTTEIAANAFSAVSLTQIYLPESVSIIRNDAFAAKNGAPLFVRLPDGLKAIPGKAFKKWRYDEENDIEMDPQYYVATSSSEIAEKIACSSYNITVHPIYQGPIDDLSTKIKTLAMLGFLFAVEHALVDMSQWQSSYFAYLKRNKKTYMSRAKENHFLLRLMMEQKLLSAKDTEDLIESFHSSNKVGMVAVMLDYHNALALQENEFELSLQETPKERRMAAVQERREQIKNQKGIRGIVFVATGDLVNFGFEDMYTGAKDLSDLKEYIESRGGYLRSTVSSKTDYLICNNPNSNTKKSKDAKALGVPVITEKEFLEMAKE